MFLGLAVLVILECHSKRFGDGCLSETPFSYTLLGGECKVECAFITLPKLFGSFSNFDLAELAAEKIPRKEINQIVHG